MFLYMLMPGHLIPANSITVYIYHRYRNSIDGEQWTSFLQFITFISHSHLLLVILAFPLDFRLFQPASIINPRLYRELSDRRTSYVPLTYLQSLLENFRPQQPYVLRVIALRSFCNLVQFFFQKAVMTASSFEVVMPLWISSAKEILWPTQSSRPKFADTTMKAYQRLISILILGLVTYPSMPASACPTARRNWESSQSESPLAYLLIARAQIVLKTSITSRIPLNHIWK